MTDKFTFKTSDEIGKMIRDLADSDFEGKPSTAARNLIEKALNMENRFEVLEDPCPALCFIDDHYECWWGRLANTPNKTKIGKTEDAVREGCKACKKTLEFKGIKEENIELKKRLSKNVIVKVPSCTQGGRLSEDGKSLWCYLTKEYRNVHKTCKVLLNGANCKHLRWTTIETKPEHQPDINR